MNLETPSKMATLTSEVFFAFDKILMIFSPPLCAKAGVEERKAVIISIEVINFMLHVGRGVLCVALEGQICDALKLAPMTEDNTAQLGTAFTITVDCVADLGVTTGVSASDRSITVKQLAKEDAVPDDFDRPGHINPLRAADGGVLARVGQTEGSVDLCRLANLRPAAAIIEIMNENGDMARVPDLEVLIKKYDLKMCSVADVAAYRRSLEG